MMKTFIINAAMNAVTTYKKHEVSSKLVNKEWKMLTDESSISSKYIFLKDGKLILSVNGLSTFSVWHMATESTLVMEEGVCTFLYKNVHIDENVIVFNLDGTNCYSFLTNDISQFLANVSFEDIQWYLYRKCNINILSDEQKKFLKREEEEKEKGAAA